MTTDQIITRLSALDKVHVDIEHGGYSWRERWRVVLAYQVEETSDRVTVEGRNEDFHMALAEAWNKLERIALVGIGKEAITPALDYQGVDQ